MFLSLTTRLRSSKRDFALPNPSARSCSSHSPPWSQIGQSSGWLISRNSIVAFCAASARARTGEDLHSLGDRRRAGRHGLRRFLDLDEAHAAVGGDSQLFVIAEARHVDARLVGQLHDHLALARLERPAVDLDVDDVFAHATACAGASTMLFPPCSIMYSNSWRKWRMKLCTGQAAASPSAQIVWPSIWFATWTRRSRSVIRPCPARIRRSMRVSQPVPSRQGVHCPQDSAM